MRQERATSTFLSVLCWLGNRPPIIAGLGKDETEKESANLQLLVGRTFKYPDMSIIFGCSSGPTAGTRQA
jgi:hypothetical protein